MGMVMDNKTRSELRTYAWNYFSLHATQRLTTFNFYLVISTLLTGGLASAIKQEYGNLWIAVVVGLLMGIFSIVFHKLDVRNRELVKNAERALRSLDDQMGLEDKGGIPNELKLVARDDYEVEDAEKKQKKNGFWPSQLHLRYLHCFNYVFLTFGAVGIGTAFIIAIIVIFKYLPNV